MVAIFAEGIRVVHAADLSTGNLVLGKRVLRHCAISPPCPTARRNLPFYRRVEVCLLYEGNRGLRRRLVDAEAPRGGEPFLGRVIVRMVALFAEGIRVVHAAACTAADGDSAALNLDLGPHAVLNLEYAVSDLHVLGPATCQCLCAGTERAHACRAAL